jgi:hypothetical protein
MYATDHSLLFPRTIDKSDKPASADGNGNNGNGNNGNGNFPSCFLRGTAIRTAGGDRKVEDLAIGDLVPTVYGGMRPIQWIGRYCYRRGDASKPWAKSVRPVRIARSALGADTPRADLYLTQLHALLIDGVLVRADSLINDTTITLDTADEFDELEFFHIKLENHDVIYAEGAACETLLPEAATADEGPCAPLLSFNVPGARMKSRFRSAISPWIDRRQKIDVIRDRLEERGIALAGS